MFRGLNARGANALMQLALVAVEGECLIIKTGNAGLLGVCAPDLRLGGPG